MLQTITEQQILLDSCEEYSDILKLNFDAFYKRLQRPCLFYYLIMIAMLVTFFLSKYPYQLIGNNCSTKFFFNTSICCTEVYASLRISKDDICSKNLVNPYFCRYSDNFWSNYDGSTLISMNLL